MLIPNHVTNFSVFLAGTRLIGVVDMELPHLENMTDVLKGSGIFGEIDMPVQAHWKNSVITMHWQTIIDMAVFSTIQNGGSLDAWSAMQRHDSGTNQIVHEGWRFIMGVAPKGFNLGKLEVGVKGDVVTEHEMISLKCLFNDVVMFQIDKENAICRWWDGHTLVDSGARIRQLIGL